MQRLLPTSAPSVARPAQSGGAAWRPAARRQRHRLVVASTASAHSSSVGSSSTGQKKALVVGGGWAGEFSYLCYSCRCRLAAAVSQLPLTVARPLPAKPPPQGLVPPSTWLSRAMMSLCWMPHPTQAACQVGSTAWPVHAACISWLHKLALVLCQSIRRRPLICAVRCLPACLSPLPQLAGAHPRGVQWRLG